MSGSRADGATVDCANDVRVRDGLVNKSFTICCSCAVKSAMGDAGRDGVGVASGSWLERFDLVAVSAEGAWYSSSYGAPFLINRGTSLA